MIRLVGRINLALPLQKLANLVFPDEFWCRFSCQYQNLFAIPIDMELTRPDNSRDFGIVFHGLQKMMICSVLIKKFLLKM